MSQSLQRFSLLVLTLALGACVNAVHYTAPEPKHIDEWHTPLQLDTTLDITAPANWWLYIQDPTLSQLIQEASQYNLDLKVAAANIQKAKAAVDLASAGYQPTLDANVSGKRSKFSSQTGFGINTGTRNSYNGGLEASWEPDFFGKTSANVAMAEANLGGSEAISHGLLLSITAEVASNYFEIRGLQQQLRNTKHNVELLQSVEAIAQAQYDSGIATGLDLAMAQGERQSFMARIPNLEAEITTRIYRISVLTGRAPETHLNRFNNAATFIMPPDNVPVGLRSDILKRRPDIHQAERELAAATANVNYTQADLFPSFSLTGAIGSSALVFSDLFSAATLTNTLGAALSWPVYAGGTYAATVDMAKADLQAALAQYDQSVLLALEDAEAALMRYGKAWQTLQQLRLSEETRQQAASIARLRYEAGEEPLLTVLDAERALITTSNDVITAQTQVLTQLTVLYKALGGGWMPVQQPTN